MIYLIKTIAKDNKNDNEIDYLVEGDKQEALEFAQVLQDDYLEKYDIKLEAESSIWKNIGNISLHYPNSSGTVYYIWLNNKSYIEKQFDAKGFERRGEYK